MYTYTYTYIQQLYYMYTYTHMHIRGTGSGFLRKSTGAKGEQRFSTNTCRKLVLVLAEISERLRKPPGADGRMSRSPVLQFPLSAARRG